MSDTTAQDVSGTAGTLGDGTADDIRPWRTTRVDVRYDNPWITVTHREVIAPTGKPGIYGVVNFKVRAVGVLPLDDELHVWLVGQWRYTLDAWSWEIPEGGAPEGEPLLDAARRELAEECGLTASRWSPLLEIHTCNSVTDERGTVWLARGLAPAARAPDDTELLDVRRVPFREALAMAMDGRITDSVSMAALMKLGLLLERGGPDALDVAEAARTVDAVEGPER